MFFVVSACASVCVAQPVAISPRWQVNFPPAANGKPGESTAVPVNGASMMVVVVAAGANPTNPTLQTGGRAVPAKMIGHDPVSRLGFIKVEGSVVPKSIAWAADAAASTTLQAMEPAGLAKCRTTGWVKQVGEKILPLALLRVNFSNSVPPPGTPLLDDAGRVVAIVFQSSGGGNVGYALPAEAVHRVLRDISTGGQLSRGWLGLALRAESQIPRISRMLPDSPAAAAGIQPNDVLLSIGSRQITDYADAANAFFYLIPGQPVRVKLLRNVEQLEFTLMPTRPKG